MIRAEVGREWRYVFLNFTRIWRFKDHLNSFCCWCMVDFLLFSRQLLVFSTKCISRCCQCSKVQIFCHRIILSACFDYPQDGLSPKSSHYTERGSSKESSLEILPSHVRHASTISCVPPLVTWWKERDRGAGPIYILCWRINANQLVLRFLLQAPLMHQLMHFHHIFTVHLLQRWGVVVA